MEPMFASKEPTEEEIQADYDWLVDELENLDITDWDSIERHIKTTILIMIAVPAKFMKCSGELRDDFDAWMYLRSQLKSLKSALRWASLFGYESKDSGTALIRRLRKAPKPPLGPFPSERNYYTEGAIILLSLSTTPPVAARFPDKISLIKRSYEDQIARRAVRVYNTYAAKAFRI